MNSPNLALDARIHAYDSDAGWVEESLGKQLRDSQPQINWTSVQPKPAICGPARLSFRAKPDASSPQVTEALPGERLQVLWEQDNWMLVRTTHDGYLGWVPKAALPSQSSQALPLDLKVTALRAHAFAGPKVSQTILAELCLGARLARGEGEVVEDQFRRWLPVILPDGAAAWVQEVCFAPIPQGSPAEFALRFLETPYVWGGRTAWGLDCSGLTQTVYAAYGVSLPRDADQQQAFLPSTTAPRAGDLAFFPGHVGLMLSEKQMIHANATHMKVSIETFGVGNYGQRLADGCLGFGRVAL